jgi:hypothetical protein
VTLWEMEERIDAWRHQLDIEGFPSAADTWRLAALLEAAGMLRVRMTATRVPYVGARGVIYLPEHWEREEQGEALLEEIGHVVCGGADADAFPDECGAGRMYRLWDARQERKAQEFRLAWKLPRHLILRYPEMEELAHEAGCLLPDVNLRLEMLLR